MSEASSTTTDDESRLKRLAEAAAGVVAGSKNIIGVRKAMEYVGFSAEEAKSMRLYQKVRRRAKRLEVVDKDKKAKKATAAVAEEERTPPPGAVDETGNSTALSSLTFSESNGINSGDNNDTHGDDTTSIDSARRRLLVEQESEAKSVKSRRSSKELHKKNAADCAARARDSRAMKSATTLIKRSLDLPKNHPEKKSINQIVDTTNKLYKSSITAPTASRYVRQGMIGVSPLKRGPVGDFPKPVYSALKGAYATYLKLEQANCKSQSGTIQMSKLINAVVNSVGHSKHRTDLTRKLQRDTADQFNIGKPNVEEYRRVQWTTAHNLDKWFTTWKETLIELGFCREKEPEDTQEGELFFHKDQLRRIINLDETDGSIDDTTGQRGGRPTLVFTAPEVAGGATAVNKSGYSSTIICGSNAAGEPLPVHFQLKTMAKNEENQRISVDWFAATKKVVGRFGFQTTQSFPCTFGMNEKAGMNAVELDKYIANSILPLYPDAEDLPRKRVIMKVDSGPGRMNLDMLAKLRLQGFYLIPGVPNTTGQTQETDQNYGSFKSCYRDNIRRLSQARFDRGLSLRVTDLPLLVFGGYCSSTNVSLKDSFTQAFSHISNLACWRKCGAVPLTREPLLSKKVRRQVAAGAAAAALSPGEENEDPEVLRIKSIVALNQFYCQVLRSHGMDASRLVKEAPKRYTQVAVTQPLSQARILAIKDAKTAGQLFHATGGRHINSDDFFKARELKKRDAEIAAMEEEKKQRAKYCKEQKGAVMLIRDKGELTHETEKEFNLNDIKMLLKWKKVKAASTRKRDLIDAYIAAPKPKIQKIWCRSEEAKLQDLKKQNVPLKDTALGVAAEQMARAVTNNLAHLDKKMIDSLKVAIQDIEESNPDNVI